MSNWSEGYVTDIAYTYGYYPELNPLRARWALWRAGFQAPSTHQACELGFGQGLSINIHAAGSEVHWCGTDFNPSQASFAQHLARASGASVSLADEAFEAFCTRDDLPDFDYIGLHGIWSWISDKNRRVIAEFLRRKLRVGGVAYISYNTMPGWAAFAPMRELLLQHYQRLGSAGLGVNARIDGALAFAKALMKTQPKVASALPSMVSRLEKVETQARSYLAHEYFNADWAPMYFSDMANWLADSKLSFACSAHLTDHVDNLNLTEEQSHLLRGIPDACMKESVRDLMVNQQFRRDLWVKGPLRMRASERLRALRSQRLLLVVPRDSVKLKVGGARGEAEMSSPVYSRVLDELAEAPLRARSVAELEAALARTVPVSMGVLVEVVSLLVATGQVQLAQDADPSPAVRGAARRLNMALTDMARDGAEIRHMCSPVLGGNLELGRFDQMFLAEAGRGDTTPEALAVAVWTLLEAAGERLVGSDGKPLPNPADNVAELTRRAQVFLSQRWPILVAAGLAD